ncbi:hypothetical protein M0813_04007 [Anaeramoeba flamelloides]|uniref:Uncharacterized protein n=1 Tax=Anaeramoeba flamelloides TaxID=1746091 RepID=A0ABQ8XNL4_9EUKA|nr:hypothetical protein M0813_04007 [Anaeramoeba flamelloides]
MSLITREIENLYDLPFTEPNFEYSNGSTSSSQEESAGISNSDEETNNNPNFSANSEEIEKLQKKLDNFSKEVKNFKKKSNFPSFECDPKTDLTDSLSKFKKKFLKQLKD